MKELTIEEKAKRYDEILAKAKRYYNEYKTRDNILYVEDIEDMFHELKESEDEKLKEQVVYAINQLHVCECTKNKLIAWLEKQSEKIDAIKNFDTEFEKQVSYLVASVINGEYEYTEAFVKWAANGLLVYAKHEIEKQYTKISVYKDTLFKIATILSQYEDKEDSPLEKIRSIMIDGTICSMDIESKKKERNKQKLTDEEMKILLQTEYEKGKADAIEAAMKAVTKDKESAIKFLKSAGIMDDNGKLAKEYVADNIEQNPAWSEEDENRFRNLIYLVEHNEKSKGTKQGFIEFINRLKSLKETYTWKPSDEQIYALRSVVTEVKHSDNKYQEAIEDLYNDLKKLSDE